MNNTWKLSVLGGVALVASACVAAAGCTVTTSSGDLDGGTFGNDTGTTSDTGTHADGGAGTDTGTGTDSGPSCTATAACPIIGSSKGVNFDPPGTCGTCDNCMATKCCAETTTCFTRDADGGKSACEELIDCVTTCDTADAGNSCKQACAAGNPDGVAPAQNLQTCLETECGANDGGTPACQ